MDMQKRGRGRPSVDPALKHRGLTVSMPPSVIQRIETAAAERRTTMAAMLLEFIERGLIEHETSKRREKAWTR